MRLTLLFYCLLPFVLSAQDIEHAVNLTEHNSNDHQKSETEKRKPVETLLSERVLPIESYFRDRMLTGMSFTPTFPVQNSKVMYFEQVMDYTPRYSTFGHYLYNRELIEIKEDQAKLWITPLFDISYGRDLVADSMNKISQNTRGVRMEGNFNNKVTFSTSFFENQAILPNYAGAYAAGKGEFYPNTGDSSYFQQNATISGAARTKPFETNGFDSAYAVGFVSFKLAKQMSLSVGNNSLFVGSGYRSMLWSDHSLGAMNVRYQWDIGSKWSFQVVRMKGMNMLRRLGSVNAEAYYEPTALSMSTLYFHPTQNSSIGLFEGGVWYRGDSLLKSPVSPLYFIPLPGASMLEEASGGKSNTVLGLDANVHTRFMMLYGQVALNPMVEKSTTFQVGTRLYTVKLPGSFIQFEYNQADEKAYTASNPRMNYASYNLPLAHPAGTNFQEFLFRGNYEMDHIFFSTALHYYPKQVEQSTLLPVYSSTDPTFRKVILSVTELGYRFNRSYGLDAFIQFRYRKGEGTVTSEASWISAGIRTAIRNHYYDY